MATLTQGIEGQLSLNTQKYTQSIKEAKRATKDFESAGVAAGRTIKSAWDRDFNAMRRNYAVTLGLMKRGTDQFRDSGILSMRTLRVSAASAFLLMRRTAESFKVSAIIAFRELRDTAGGIFRSIGTFWIAALGAASAFILRSMSRVAAEAEEIASKFGFVFGEEAGAVTSNLERFADAAGRSSIRLRGMAADIGALIGPMLGSNRATAALSSSFTKLATDLSSFFDIAESDALTALRSGLVGEAEPLRRVGVQLNAAKIEQEAFNLGLIESRKELDATRKTLAIYSIVMRETAQAQGDAIRTSQSFTNQTRRLKAEVFELQAIFGQELNKAILVTIAEMGGMDKAIDQVRLAFRLMVESGKLFIDFSGRAIKRTSELINQMGGVDAVALTIRETFLRLKFGFEFTFGAMKVGLIIIREFLAAAALNAKSFWLAMTFRFRESLAAFNEANKKVINLSDTLSRETEKNSKQLKQTAAEIIVAAEDAALARRRFAEGAADRIRKSAKSETEAYGESAEEIKRFSDEVAKKRIADSQKAEKALLKEISKTISSFESLEQKILTERRRRTERVNSFIEGRQNRLFESQVKGWGKATAASQQYLKQIEKNVTTQEGLDRVVQSFFDTQNLELKDAQKEVKRLTADFQDFDQTIRGVKASANLSGRQLALNAKQAKDEIESRRGISRSQKELLKSNIDQQQRLNRARLRFDATEKIREEESARMKANEAITEAKKRLKFLREEIDKNSESIINAAVERGLELTKNIDSIKEVNALLAEGIVNEKESLNIIRERVAELQKMLDKNLELNALRKQQEDMKEAGGQVRGSQLPLTGGETSAVMRGPNTREATSLPGSTTTINNFNQAGGEVPTSVSSSNVNIGDIIIQTEITGNQDVDIQELAKRLKLGIQRKQISLT